MFALMLNLMVRLAQAGVGQLTSEAVTETLQGAYDLGAKEGSAARGRVLDSVTVGDILDLLRNRHKIQAIKLYRNATGYALRESKTVIDGWEKSIAKVPNRETY